MPIRIAVVVLAALAIAVAPASAAEPVRDTVEIHNAVSDTGENCGFPVLWDIHISADRLRFYDDSGQLTREIVHIREDNTVTNLSTGKTLRDGPVQFTRRHEYEDGRRVLTVDSGVMVNIRDGDERVLDIGRVEYRTLPDGRWDVIATAGHHPVYEALDEKPFTAALGAFCTVLD